MIALLLACARPEPPRVVGAPELSVDAPLVRAEVPAAPASWGANAWSGPDPGLKAEVKWTVKLDRPLRAPPLPHEGGFLLLHGGGLSRVEADGRVVWTQAAQASGNLQLRPEGVLWGADGQARISDPRTGATLSTRPLPSPLLGTQGELIICQDGSLVLGDREASLPLLFVGPPVGAGAETWAASKDGEIVHFVGLDATERLPLAGPAHLPALFDGERVYAAAGKEIWAFAGASWKVPVGSTPLGMALGAGALVVAMPEAVLGLNPADGAELWRVPLPSPPVAGVGVIGRRAWLGLADGTAFGLDLDDAAPWGQVALGVPAVSAPVAAGGLTLFGLADGRVVALGAGS